jgi:phosphopentomutase
MRAILLVMDSVGIGSAPDAAAYGDAGANTTRHIAEAARAAKPTVTGVWDHCTYAAGP